MNARACTWLIVMLGGLIGAVSADEGTQTASVAPPGPKPALVVPLATRAVFLDVQQAGDRLVAVGERGIVVYSDDAGSSWKQAQVPVRGTLTAATFVDDKTGFAVGHDAAILRTRDAGATWELVQYDPGRQNVYLNIRFRTPQMGYITGTNGELLITLDGGASWQSQTLSVEEWYQNHLFDVAWTSSATLVAAEKGVLYRSPDGLANWEPIPSPYEGSYFGALSLPSGGILLYGMSGRVFYSADAGDSFTPIESGTEQFLYDAALLPDGRALLVGAGGTYLVVDPTSGTAVTNQRGNRVGFTAVLVHGGRAFLAAAGGGVVSVPLAELVLTDIAK